VAADWVAALREVDGGIDTKIDLCMADVIGRGTASKSSSVSMRSAWTARRMSPSGASKTPCDDSDSPSTDTEVGSSTAAGFPPVKGLEPSAVNERLRRTARERRPERI